MPGGVPQNNHEVQPAQDGGGAGGADRLVQAGETWGAGAGGYLHNLVRALRGEINRPRPFKGE